MEERGVVLATPTVMEQPGDQQPWHRLLDEPTRLYDYFLVYRNLGPSRTILAAYRKYKVMQGHTQYRNATQASTDWYKHSKTFGWYDRATRYDDYTMRQAEAETEALVKQWYIDSRKDLVYCWRDLRNEWDLAEPGNMSKNQVTQAMKTISQLTTPTTPTQSIDVQIILDKLPPDVQTALLDSLSKS